MNILSSPVFAFRFAVVSACFFVGTLLVSCTDTAKARVGAFSKPKFVCLYSADGRIIHKWKSSGQVQSRGGFYAFADAESGEYVSIAGTAIVSAKDFCHE